MLGFAPLASLTLGDDAAAAASASTDTISAFAFGNQIGAAILGARGADSTAYGGLAVNTSGSGGNAANAFATGKSGAYAS